MEMKKKIALGQLSALPSMSDNLKKAAAQIDEAAEKGAKLILFPEIGFELFFPKHPHDVSKFQSSESIPGPISEFLCQKAKEKNIVIVASYMEEGFLGEYYDSAVCIDADGTLLGTTRMVHTFENKGFNEKFYYGPGNTIYPVYETAAGNIGIAICYDAWFPEVTRSLALRGADLILVPTVEMYIDGLPPTDHIGGTIFEALCTMQKANAIHNGVWVAFCNRVGIEDDMHYMGSSLVIDPWGHIQEMANAETDEVLIAEIDLEQNRKVRQIWPMLRDRRVDTYELLMTSFGSKPYYHPTKVRI
ncbi:nitrilase-related carbon-nitrogen hydrolase [Brevibacillus sp. NRS-1366]|uniref:nitrilase-related carbon-nitrogen hydrolase n=1 Tax=Brevibacillus sp. NRS-1366 TaxID=3233899 RepID=UPI003D1BFC26